MRDSALQQRVDQLRDRIDGLRAQLGQMSWSTAKERDYVITAMRRAQRQLAMLLEDERSGGSHA